MTLHLFNILTIQLVNSCIAAITPYYTTIWFILVGVLFTGYAMLDGFDLGVGALHLLVSKDEDRRIFLNAIGPVWDGNEVWLVVAGGALFAAFPGAYATVFSGFYMPFVMKTEGPLQERVKRWVPKLILLFIAFYFSFNVSTLFACPDLAKIIFSRPLIFVVLALDMLLLFNVWRLVQAGKEFAAFLSSCLMMAFLMATFGLSYYPNMVISSPHPENSLTITNASSTNYTLGLLCVIVCIGMPMVLTYTTSVYWIFRGKTKLTDTSY